LPGSDIETKCAESELPIRYHFSTFRGYPRTFSEVSQDTLSVIAILVARGRKLRNCVPAPDLPRQALETVTFCSLALVKAHSRRRPFHHCAGRGACRRLHENADSAFEVCGEKDCENMTDINLTGTPGTPGVNGTTPGQAGTGGGPGGNAAPAQNTGNGIDTLNTEEATGGAGGAGGNGGSGSGTGGNAGAGGNGGNATASVSTTLNSTAGITSTATATGGAGGNAGNPGNLYGGDTLDKGPMAEMVEQRRPQRPQ
jgi:hypothetical protein